MITPLAERWDHADRLALEALCLRARLKPELANLSWRDLEPDARQRLEKADKEAP